MEKRITKGGRFMKDRERACVYYIAEGQCSKGHEGTFRKACQRCKHYCALKGGNVARKDLRREKRDKYTKDKRNWGDY